MEEEKKKQFMELINSVDYVDLVAMGRTITAKIISMSNINNKKNDD